MCYYFLSNEHFRPPLKREPECGGKQAKLAGKRAGRLAGARGGARVVGVETVGRLVGRPAVVEAGKEELSLGRRRPRARRTEARG